MQKDIRLCVKGVQVNQGIQNFKNDVILIDKKPTLIRVHIEIDGRHNGVFSIRGEIKLAEIKKGGKRRLIRDDIRSLNTLVLDTAQQNSVQRVNIEYGKTLNFFFDGDTACSSDKCVIEISLSTLSYSSEQQRSYKDVKIDKCTDSNFNYPVCVTFHKQPSLNIRVLGLRYVDKDLGIFQPRSTHFDNMKNSITKTFPVETIGWSDTIIDADKSFASPFSSRAEIDIDDVWFDKVVRLHAQLLAIRTMDLRFQPAAKQNYSNKPNAYGNTWYYGMVNYPSDDFFRGAASDIQEAEFYELGGFAENTTSSLNNEIVSVGPAATSQNDFFGAHEIAHCLDMLHPGYGGQPTVDRYFPYLDGKITGEGISVDQIEKIFGPNPSIGRDLFKLLEEEFNNESSEIEFTETYKVNENITYKRVHTDLRGNIRGLVGKWYENLDALADKSGPNTQKQIRAELAKLYQYAQVNDKKDIQKLIHRFKKSIDQLDPERWKTAFLDLVSQLYTIKINLNSNLFGANHTGWDSGDMSKREALIDGNTHFDFMTYKFPRWISAYAYKKLFLSLKAYEELIQDCGDSTLYKEKEKEKEKDIVNTCIIGVYNRSTKSAEILYFFNTYEQADKLINDEANSITNSSSSDEKSPNKETNDQIFISFTYEYYSHSKVNKTDVKKLRIDSSNERLKLLKESEFINAGVFKVVIGKKEFDYTQKITANFIFGKVPSISTLIYDKTDETSSIDIDSISIITSSQEENRDYFLKVDGEGEKSDGETYHVQIRYPMGDKVTVTKDSTNNYRQDFDKSNDKNITWDTAIPWETIAVNIEANAPIYIDKRRCNLPNSLNQFLFDKKNKLDLPSIINHIEDYEPLNKYIFMINIKVNRQAKSLKETTIFDGWVIEKFNDPDKFDYISTEADKVKLESALKKYRNSDDFAIATFSP